MVPGSLRPFSEPEAALPFAVRPQAPSNPGASTSSSSQSKGPAPSSSSCLEANIQPFFQPSRALDTEAAPVVQAHKCALRAEEALSQGLLAESVQCHLDAARLFLEAAGRVQGNDVTASALLLLSDGHARQARTVQMFLKEEQGGNGEGGGIDQPVSHKGANRGGQEAKLPPQLSKGGAAGDLRATNSSMYASAMAPEGPNAVDDMLALERALQGLGVHPVYGGGGSYHGSIVGGATGGGSARYLSSTLGESFLFIGGRNQATALDGSMVSSSVAYKSAMEKKTQTPESGPGVSAPTTRRDNEAHVKSGDDSDPYRKSSSGEGGRSSNNAGSNASGSTTKGVNPPSSTSTSSGGSTTLSRKPSKESVLKENRDKPGGSSNGKKGQEASIASSRKENQSGGGVNGVEGSVDIHQAEVMRLLECMKTLGDENASLIKRCDEAARVRQENDQLKKEMKEFKELYSARFKKLNTVLVEYAQKYPQEGNPAHHLVSMADKNRIAALEKKVQDMNVRLAQEREARRKKDEIIRQYAQYYKTLKAVKANALLKQRQHATSSPQTMASPTASTTERSNSLDSGSSRHRPPSSSSSTTTTSSNHDTSR